MTEAKPAALKRLMLQVDGVELEVFEGGTGRPLVYLPGATGFRPDAPFARLLSERFRVIVPMHPGFGSSSLPSWMDSIDDFAHVHLDVLDRLGLEQVVLVGASVGGWVAAELATKNTSRIGRIVLVGPVGIKVGPRDCLDIPDIFAMQSDELDRRLYHDPQKWRLDPAGQTDDELRILARDRETLALVTWEPYMHNPKLKRRLHRIDRPTLVLRGAKDGLVSDEYARAFAGLIPGAVFEAVPEAGHSPQIEKPEFFAARVRRFAEA